MNQDLTLRDYLRVLWSGRILILALVAVAVVVGLLTTFARSTTYTAQSQVTLGQQTSLSGVPIQTPLTVPNLAITVLKGDDVVSAVAKVTGMKDGAVRDAVTLSAPRVTGASAGNQPTLLTITAVTSSERKAVELANAYADAVMSKVSAPFASTTRVYAQQRDQANRQIEQLTASIAGWRKEMLTAGDPQLRLQLQVAIQSALDQLGRAQDKAQTATLALTKAESIERPSLASTATSATSSGSAPQRLRTAVFAGLVGLILGIIATFVWKGSPAGRAREAT